MHIISVSEDKVVKATKESSTVTYKETAIDLKDDTTTHVMVSQDEDLKTKAERAGNAVSDLIDSTIDKAASSVRAKADELLKSGALEPGYAGAKKDSADISRLGPLVTKLATVFEDTMTIVRQQPYEEQEKLLLGYRKLLEEQTNVINSRIQFAKRVH